MEMELQYFQKYLTSKIKFIKHMKSSIFLFTSFFFGFTYISHGENYESDYEELIQLFKEWRSFENPPLLERAPDYRKETFDMRQPKFKQLQAQLLAIDTSGWSINEQVDWRLVWAEMNGYDFNYRILKPWERDPAFYKTLWTERSDVPAHEGPTHHGVIDLWKYKFPLDKSSRDQLLVGLRSIPALNDQAKINLTGNAKELWAAGIPSIQVQAEELLNILKLPGVSNDPELVGAIKEASTSTDELVDWLIKIAPTKTGPSGIGKDNYTWYLQKVHLVPLTWGDEVIILKRELARAWSSLKLEEHKNLGLPELKDVSSPEEFDLMAEESIRSLLDFLDQKQIVTVKDYFEAAIREHMGSFIPKDKRNFFSIGMHYDPRPLYSHFYHWFELARMDLEPHKSEVRREALLYNIWDSRNEGTATAVEELFMNAGLYEESPRAREIV